MHRLDDVSGTVSRTEHSRCSFGGETSFTASIGTLLCQAGPERGVLGLGLGAGPIRGCWRSEVDPKSDSWTCSPLNSTQTAGAAGIIVDARNADRFDGSLQLPTDPQAGHIPGAVNVPCRGNLAPDGRLRPIAEVRRAFAKVGIEDATAVISYCGSGVTACHNLLALEHAGLGQGRLYAGGWSEYGAAPGLRAQLG